MTRMVISTNVAELPSPHFEDEATIVSARPVVPIARAGVTDGSRRLLLVVPMLLAAAVFGGVGALGVNYFQGGRRDSATSVSPPQAITQPPANETAVPQPSIEASTVTEPGGAVATTEAAAESSTSPADQASAPAKPGDDSIEPAKPVVAAPRAAEVPSDPGRLVRKRRVIEVSEPRRLVPQPRSRPVTSSNRSPGRIREIFEGPNR